MGNVLEFGVVPPPRAPTRIRAEQPRLAAEGRHFAEVVVQRRDPQHQPPLGLVRLAPVPVPLVVRPDGELVLNIFVQNWIRWECT